MQIKVREQLGEVINHLGLEGLGVEVGVAEGKFSKILLETSNLEKIMLIDSWKHYAEGYVDSNNADDNIQEERYLNVLREMSNMYGERVTVIRANSRNAVCDLAHCCLRLQ